MNRRPALLLPLPLPLRTLALQTLALAAVLWLAGCAGLSSGASDAGPAFRDARLTVQAASAAVVPGQSTKAEVAALLGPASVIAFDSGYEIWLYRVQESSAGKTEFVILFAPGGTVKKTRIRTP